MKITTQQMNAPAAGDPEEMRAAILKWWIDNDPDMLADFGMGLLAEMAEAARILAKRHRFTSQPEVCAFANLMWLFGPSFDDHPEIRTVLDAPQSEEQRIERLYTEVPDAVWDQADANRDEGRWVDILASEA